MKERIYESTKEFLRVVVLAVIPVLILGLENGALDWKTVGVVGATAGLRFVDKLLYLNQKEDLTRGQTLEGKWTGLTGI